MFRFLAPCLVVGLLVGCGAVPERPDENLSAAIEIPVAAPLNIRTLNLAGQFVTRDSRAARAQLLNARRGTSMDILALSGGGAAGAFGAGAIVGLSRSGQLPRFAVVTGVSAGALVAPYAFAGPRWDDQLADIYLQGAGERIMQSRPLGAVFGSSLYRGAPLHELVDRYATDELIQAVAAEARSGRLLLVATTDFQSGLPVIWDLGSVAMNGGAEAHALFRDILVASASVPGLFPPVTMQIRDKDGVHEEIHVDGAVTAPFFVAPVLSRQESGDPAGQQAPRVYVIIDGPLSESPHATPLRTGAILSRSVEAGLNRMLRTTLELTAATSQQQGMSLDYSAIPLSYPFRDAFDFSRASVRPLFDYAYDCALSGHLWTSFASAAAGAIGEGEHSCPAPRIAGAQLAELAP